MELGMLRARAKPTSVTTTLEPLYLKADWVVRMTERTAELVMVIIFHEEDRRAWLVHRTVTL